VTAVTEETLPAVFGHSKVVYEEMFKRASMTPVANDNPMMVYEGMLTTLFDELHLSVPFYTSVMGCLKRMGCVRQLRRGGGNSPSQWELITSPTEELFWRTKADRVKGPTLPEVVTAQAAIEQQVRDLKKLTNELTEALGQVISHLQQKGVL
jgi:hypothetical protein